MNVACESTPAEIQYEPDCSSEEMSHVLAVLDRWSRRTAKYVRHARACHRHEYRTMVMVEVNDQEDEIPLRRVFRVPARNVSKTGLGIIAPPVFVPRSQSDATSILRADMVFRLGAKVKITLGSRLQAATIVRAQVTRMRLIHNGFFDIGVRFLSRES
jgi:hypothetical protein